MTIDKNMFFIYLIILSLPFYLIRFSISGFGVNVLDMLLFSFVSLGMIKYLFSDKHSFKEVALLIYPSVKKFLVPTALIVIGLSLSALKSEDIFASMGIIKSWFVLPILFFAWSASIVDSDDKKKNIFRVWFWGGCLVALVSLIYYLVGNMTYDGRLSSFFSSPNDLAMFLAPSFIIGVWLLLSENDRHHKFIYGVIGLIFIGAIIFATKSLGGFAAILLSFIFLMINFFKTKENRRRLIFLLALFLICITGYLLYIHDFGDRSSLMSRMMIWQSALKILGDNFILGIGPGMFQENYLSYQKYFTPYLEWAVPHPHNIFLAFWLQSGLIGLIGFLWLIVIFFKNIWKNKDDDTILLCGALMIYFLVHGLIDVTYWRNDLAVMFWLAVLLSIKK